LPRECAYGGRLFASVVPDWHCELDPRLRRKSGCTAIAAPSHPQTIASADASRTLKEYPSWLRDEKTRPCSKAWKLGDISSLPCRVSGTGEGHEILIHSLLLLSISDHNMVCATLRQVQHCNSLTQFYTLSVTTLPQLRFLFLPCHALQMPFLVVESREHLIARAPHNSFACDPVGA
jgi:hypothetical protein